MQGAAPHTALPVHEHAGRFYRDWHLNWAELGLASPGGVGRSSP